MHLPDTTHIRAEGTQPSVYFSAGSSREEIGCFSLHHYEYVSAPSRLLELLLSGEATWYAETLRGCSKDMSLWLWTFLVALFTATVGLVLFAGFSFQKKKLRYPFLFVTFHVLGTTATVILFCILFVRWITHHDVTHPYGSVVLWLSLVVVLATFVSGIYFYFWYNARGRGLSYRLLVTHLAMASLAFVSVITSVAEFSNTGIHPGESYRTTGYNFYKHRNIRLQSQLYIERHYPEK